MSNYAIVSAVVEAYAGPTPTIVQVDAPAGYYIVATFAKADGGSEYKPWSPYEYVVDGEDRITGAVFFGNEDVPNRDDDYTAYAVCVAGEAVPPPSGTATLVAGTVNVPHPSVTANSRIWLQRHTAGGTTTGNVYQVTARTPGTGFTITAIVLSTGLTGTLDTSTVDWLLIEP